MNSSVLLDDGEKGPRMCTAAGRAGEAGRGIEGGSRVPQAVGDDAETGRLARSITRRSPVRMNGAIGHCAYGGLRRR